MMMLAVPAAICLRYNSWPALTDVLKGFVGVAPIFWTVGTIEVITYVPMLGVGGSYLGFVTGNLSNLKVPCALNAMQSAGVDAGSEEGELISTVAIATSSIVTTVIIAAGVLLLAQIRPLFGKRVHAAGVDTFCPRCSAGWPWCTFRATEDRPYPAHLHGGAVCVRAQPGELGGRFGAGGRHHRHRRGAHSVQKGQAVSRLLRAGRRPASECR